MGASCCARTRNAIRGRLGTEPMGSDQFETTFGDLPTDAEG